MPFWRLHYHLVWATTQRLPLIDDRVEEAIRVSINSTVSRMHLIVHAIRMVEDHAHVLVSIPPMITVADVAGRFKGASSRLVNQRLGGLSFGWQNEYGALTFSDRSLPMVTEYVLDQRERHANQTTLPTMEMITPSLPQTSEPDYLQPV